MGNIKQISYRDVRGSVINYPQESLPKYMWDKNDEFILKPKVKQLIQEYVGKTIDNFSDSNLWFRGMLLGSSIATQFYDENTDIDIKILIDTEVFKNYNSKYSGMNEEDFVKETKDKLDEISTTGNFKFLTHPFEFFFIDIAELNNPKFIKHFDALYDVNGDRWIRGPKLVDVKNYDRDIVTEKGEKLALTWATQWDLDLGEIKRHVKEFDLVNNYIKSIKNRSDRYKFKAKIEKLLQKIENEITELSDEKKSIVNQRHRAYIDYQDDIEKYYGMINAHPAVVQMKFLAYWGYFTIIKELNKIIKNEELNRNNIENVKKVIEKEKV